jgi:hypothetical protein
MSAVDDIQQARITPTVEPLTLTEFVLFRVPADQQNVLRRSTPEARTGWDGGIGDPFVFVTTAIVIDAAQSQVSFGTVSKDRQFPRRSLRPSPQSGWVTWSRGKKLTNIDSVP